jgi:hypothetical protein
MVKFYNHLSVLALKQVMALLLLWVQWLVFRRLMGLVRQRGDQEH